MPSRADYFLELCRRDYRAYCAYSNNNRWIAGKAVSYICNTVQEFLHKETGHAYDILVLSIPPQHGKSYTITETLPSWYLINNPTKRVIEISYSEDFAQLFGRRNRAKINEYGGYFGTTLAATPNSNTEFETTDGGGMISRGVLSGVTGRPCDLMIIDDPIKNRMEADSETYRERVWNEWQDSFKSRLAAGAKVILIQTRWHEDDLAGRIIARENNVTVVNLPCEAEENDPIGRKVGEALCPEIGKDNAWLKDFKASYEDGSRSWNALYQGHPSVEAGNILKREWWRYYDKPLEKYKRTVISVDASFKNGDDNDYVAITVWGKQGADIDLLDMVHEHLDFVETVNEIKRLTEEYPSYNAIYIEDKANGSAIISFLRHEIPRIIAINPNGGKIARVNAVTGVIEAGNVRLPKKAKWLNEFITECASFPRGAHDDMVDSMSQCLMKEYNKKATDTPKAKPRRREDFFDMDNIGRKKPIYGGKVKVF